MMLMDDDIELAPHVRSSETPKNLLRPYRGMTRSFLFSHTQTPRPHFPFHVLFTLEGQVLYCIGARRRHRV